MTFGRKRAPRPRSMGPLGHLGVMHGIMIALALLIALALWGLTLFWRFVLCAGFLFWLFRKR